MIKAIIRLYAANIYKKSFKKFLSSSFEIMNKLFICTTIMVLCFTAYSQQIEEKEYAIELTEVINFDMTIDEAFDALKLYFAQTYVNSNNTSRDAGTKALVYDGRFKNMNYLLGVRTDAFHTVKVEFREGRCKLTISVSSFEIITTTTGQTTTNTWKQIYDKRTDNPGWFKRFWTNTVQNTKNEMLDIEKGVKNALTEKVDNDW